jgi:hypothetical protein
VDRAAELSFHVALLEFEVLADPHPLGLRLAVNETEPTHGRMGERLPDGC